MFGISITENTQLLASILKLLFTFSQPLEGPVYRSAANVSRPAAEAHPTHAQVPWVPRPTSADSDSASEWKQRSRSKDATRGSWPYY